MNTNTKGFTLIELVVTLVIAGIIASSLVLVTISTMNQIELITMNSEVSRNGTKAVRNFAREAAHLGDAATPIFTAAIDRVKFKSVLGRPMEYYFSNGSLFMDLGGANDPAILCGGVNSGQSFFRYYDSNDAIMTDLPLSATRRLEVKTIEINLALNDQNSTATFNRKVTPLNNRWKSVQ